MTTDSERDADIQEALPQQDEFYRAPVRFGSVPVDAHRKGYDPRGGGFRKHYPRVSLPTQIAEPGAVATAPGSFWEFHRRLRPRTVATDVIILELMAWSGNYRI